MSFEIEADDREQRGDREIKKIGRRIADGNKRVDRVYEMSIRVQSLLEQVVTSESVCLSNAGRDWIS